MKTKKKNAIFGRYPCCDLVNNAIRCILKGETNYAIIELYHAIHEAGGYLHKDIEVSAIEAKDRVWAKNKSEANIKNPCADCKESAFSASCHCDEFLKYQVTQKMKDHANEISMPKTVTLELNCSELFLIQEMMREAKANPCHSDDYCDEETEKLIHKITDALNETYEEWFKVLFGH